MAAGNWQAGGTTVVGSALDSTSVTMNDGTAQTVDLTGYGFPLRVWVNPGGSDTVLVEINQGGWATVDSYVAEAEFILDYNSDETAITDIRFTRSGGSGTASKAYVGPNVVGTAVDYGISQVSGSRSLTTADNGQVLELTSATLTLTVPTGLGSTFSCVVIPNGTTSIASSGGTLLNGATTTLTRAYSSNPMFAIQARASASNSYVVSGV